MEGIINILAWMGGVSIYLVIASAVGRVIYDKTEEVTEDGRLLLSIMGAVFFPITIPLMICILWAGAMINIPLGKEEEKESVPEEKREFNTKVKTKFKAGDLVTGVKGNPGGYNIFYEGCVCRVLDTGRRQVKLKLVDHIDNDANEDAFGRIDWFPQEEFTLITQEKDLKKVVKKKKR